MYKRLLALFGAVALMGGGCWLYPTDDRQPDAMEPKNGAPTEEQNGNGKQKENGMMEGDAEVMTEATGSWKMNRVRRAGQKEEFVSTSNFTLTLDSEGRLGAKICNGMSGSYSIEDGELKTAEVISTLMFCPGLPGDVEAAFTADLATGLSVNIAGATMTLTGTTSGNVYTFVKM
jgi:heat shock protein HslJ